MSNGYYKNEQLKEYFENYVSDLNVDERYHPILVDILLRRADLYDLSPEEIQQDVVSLVYNLEKIEIATMPENHKNVAGVFFSEEKRIAISKEYATEINSEKLYQILTHEVYHVLLYDENGEDRLEKYNIYTQKYNSTLLEAIVEKASYRAVFGNNKQDNIYFNNSANGYRDITFIVDAIEATYGVSEQDFLKNALKGREELAIFLANQVGEEPDKAYNFLDALEANYTLLHNTMYPDAGEEITSRKQIISNIQNAMVGIYELCEYKFYERIISKDLQSYEDAVNFNNELKYNHNKFTATMQDRLEYFNVEFSPSIRRTVYNSVDSRRIDTLSIINDFDSVIASAYNFRDESEFLNVCKYAQCGQLESLDEQYLNEHGIEIKFTYYLPINREIVDKVFEGETFENEYDNKSIGFLLDQIVKEDTKKKNLFQRGFEKLRNMFIRNNQKLLNPPANDLNNRNAASNWPEPLENKNQEYNKIVAMKIERKSRREDNER